MCRPTVDALYGPPIGGSVCASRIGTRLVYSPIHLSRIVSSGFTSRLRGNAPAELAPLDYPVLRPCHIPMFLAVSDYSFSPLGWEGSSAATSLSESQYGTSAGEHTALSHTS